MKVQKIQTTNTTFGYNAELNANLIKTLEKAKKNKPYYNYLKEICNSNNTAEKKLREAERKDRPYLQSFLIASFVPMKILFTDMVDALFPNLNYRQKEIEAYSEEIEKRNLAKENPGHWMNSIVTVLNEHEAQKKAENIAGVLSQVMQEVFPDMKFDFSGLSPAFKEQYMPANVENDNIATEFDDDIQDARNLNERIKLGKEKVREYVPLTEHEKMGLASLGGMKELKETLMKKMIIPLKDPIQAKYNEEHFGITRPNGFLFYGPPGTGKTTLIERVAVETGLPLLKMSTDSFGGIYINETELAIGAAFDYAASVATDKKPVILLIDDIDTVTGNRKNPHTHEHKKDELGVWLQRIQEAPKNNIIVVAATNNYDNIDLALQGRLRNQIYAGLPDKESRIDILKMKLNETDNGKKLAADEKALDRLGNLTENFNIRALEDFVNEAREKAMIDFYNFREIKLSDFEEIIAKPENQSKKIKEQEYKNNASRTPIGFSLSTKKS